MMRRLTPDAMFVNLFLTKPMKNRTWGVSFISLALSWLCAIQLFARPRPPLPPLPEPAPVLYHADFDEPYRSQTQTATTINAAYVDWVDSWSGYALRRSGPKIMPFVVPALDVSGRTNVACADGAVRFWFKPHWTSASLPGGTGPGVEARLIEMAVVGAKDVAVAWSLTVGADGSIISLTGACGGDFGELLNAEINWQADEWHLVTLNYGPRGTALFIDGEIVAEGAGTDAVPPSVAALAVGSSLRGTDAPEGEFDEVFSFGRQLTEREVGVYFGFVQKQAALGSITREEEEAQRAAVASRAAERKAALQQAGGSQMMLLVGGTSQCVTNVPVHLTNIVFAFDINQGPTVTFDIQGGTNGLLYDVFTTTNLAGNSVTHSQWTWLERGLTCSTYQYTNQPPTVAFYLLGTPQDGDGDGLTDAFERLVTKTDPNNPDTDGDGLSDEWEYLNRLNPLVDDSGQEGSRANYVYDGAGRLRQVTGVRGKSIAVDGEGNVTRAAQ